MTWQWDVDRWQIERFLNAPSLDQKREYLKKYPPFLQIKLTTKTQIKLISCILFQSRVSILIPGQIDLTFRNR